MKMFCAKVLLSLTVASGGSAEKRAQFIRTNAPRFWDFASSGQKVAPLGEYLSFQGTIAGDPNLGNFAPSAVRTEAGEAKMRYIDIDFDDAGEGSFALNIALFIANIKTMASEIKVSEILNAYQSGLAGQKAPVTPVVKKLLDISLSDYHKKLDSYVTENTQGDKFKFKADKIEPYVAAYTPEELAGLFPGDKLLDLAIRLKSVGGSMNALRIWALIKTPSGEKKIMELKELQPSSLVNYKVQPPLSERLKKVYENLWPNLSPESYKVIQLSDGRKFWLRRKSVVLIDAPYEVKSKSDLNYIRELALYDANLMGRRDGAQAQGQEFAKTILENPDRFRSQLKEVLANYLKENPILL